MKYIVIISTLLFVNTLQAECGDLSYDECIYWGEYCEWDDSQNQCVEIGGGGGGGNNDFYGPYDFESIEQSDGMRNGPLYADATLYYPLDAPEPLKSIVFGAGWGGGGIYMSDWATLFASHGFVAVTIDYNDADNDSHQQRAEAMLDLIETIKLEHVRQASPVFNRLDTTAFGAVGYSLSGGVTQIAAVLDSTLDAVIALNPTIIVEDCNGCANYNYCICLLPEHLEHTTPALIIAGEDEILELQSYDGLLGADQYFNTPETTVKMLYEIANGDHGSAESTGSELVVEKALFWMKYHLEGQTTYCDSLLTEPNDASQFLTTLTCSPEMSIEQSSIVANQFTLHQNYPNPFNPSTTIEYELNKNGSVTIAILDIKGNNIKNLINKNQSAGRYEVEWDASGNAGEKLSAGIYFYRIHFDGKTQNRKMILLK